MKIIFFMSHAYYFFDSSKGSRVGGAELNMTNTAKELSKFKNMEIEFWTGDCNQKDIEIFESIIVRKIKYLYEYKRSLFSKVFSRIDFLIKSIMSRGDIFITSTLSDFMIIWTFLFFFSRKKRLIFRVGQDIDVNGILNNTKNLKGLLYKICLNNADNIVVQSLYQQKQLIKTQKRNSVLIKNGHILNIPEHFIQREFICWIGRAREIKKPEIFLRLAEAIPQKKFVMIISEKNNLRDSIIKKSESIKNLIIYEDLERKKILSLLQKSICLVNTSEREGFSNTWVESFMCGTPVISYNVNPDNILNHYSIGKFINNNQKKAIDFINDLNTEKQRSYFFNTIYYVIKNHDIKKSTNQYYRIIRTLCHIF